MNENLKIKVAIIRRIAMQKPATTAPTRINHTLGCDVSEEVCRYVQLVQDHHIQSDIDRGLPVAVELSNLKPNWDDR